MSINDGRVNLFKKISNMCSNASDPIKDKYPMMKEWGAEESFNDGKFFANQTAPGYSYSTVQVFKEVKAPLQTVGKDVPEKWRFADGLKNDAQGVAAQDKISQITAANRLLQRFNNPYAAEYVLGRKLTPNELLNKSVSGSDQRVPTVAGIPPEMLPAPVNPEEQYRKFRGLPEPSLPSSSIYDEYLTLDTSDKEKLFEEDIKANKGKDEVKSEIKGTDSIQFDAYYDEIMASKKPLELGSIWENIATELGFESPLELSKAITYVQSNPKVPNIASQKAGFRSLSDYKNAYKLLETLVIRQTQIGDVGTEAKAESASSSSVPSDIRQFFSPPPDYPAEPVNYSRNELRQKSVPEVKSILYQIIPPGMKKTRFNGLNKDELIDAIKEYGADRNVIVGEGVKKILPRKVKPQKRKPKQTQATPDDVDFAKEKLKVLVGSIDAGDMPNKTLINQLSTVIDFLLYHNAIPKSLAVKITKKALGK